MDGDRPMADGCDISEPEIQGVVRCASVFDPRSNVVIPDDDDQTGDVGAQDETPEARAMGDGVRSKPRLSGQDVQPTTSKRKGRVMYRYLVVEYCFEDDSWKGEKHILGAYPDIKSARVDAGKYIKEHVKKMKAKYRYWQVDVQKERMYFPIKGV